eukprot:193019_1
MSQEWTAKNVVMFSIDIITPTLAVIIFILTIYYVNKNKETLSKEKLLMIAAIICMLAHALLAITDPFMFYFQFVSYNPEANTHIFRIWYVLWAISKLTLYFVYTYRVYVIFKDSMYQQSMYRYILIGIGCICLMVSAIISIVGSNAWDDPSSDFTLGIEICVLLLDVALITVTLWLFIHPIIRLIRLRSEQEMETHHEMQQTDSTESPQSRRSTVSAQDMGLLNPAKRVALLGTISVFSSFIYQLMWVISVATNYENEDLLAMGYIWGIDTVINMICLFLSYKFARQYYKCICICDKCCEEIMVFIVVR